MFAATEYIKHLRDENEELSDAYHSLVPTKEKLVRNFLDAVRFLPQL